MDILSFFMGAFAGGLFASVITDLRTEETEAKAEAYDKLAAHKAAADALDEWHRKHQGETSV